MPTLSIIIVSWNVADMLAACLDSILRCMQPSAHNSAEQNIEIIVVDSGSTDHTISMVETHYPQVILFPQTQNLGFSRCNNIGLAAARGQYLLLLNPDAEIIGDALNRMISFMDTNPDIGMIGPHTRNADGTYQSTRRRFPTIPLAFFESTWLQPYAPQGMLDSYYVAEAPEDAVIDVDWVQGSALLTRRQVYQQIGGLDEHYVMFSEELDWCKRAKDFGWRVVYLGTARIIHYGGKSTDQVIPRRHIHFQQSKLYYYHKYHGWWVAQILRCFLIIMYTWQIALEALKGMIGHKRALRQQRIRAYWQVLRSGLKVS